MSFSNEVVEGQRREIDRLARVLEEVTKGNNALSVAIDRLRSANVALKERLSVAGTCVRGCDEIREENRKLREYIHLLREELAETAGIATVHGWLSSRADAGLKYMKELGIH